MAKRILKQWSEEEINDLKNFFKDISTKTREDKDVFAKKLDRTWTSIYNKHWDLSNPNLKKVAQQKAKERLRSKKEKDSGIKVDNEKLIVTHLKKEVSLRSFSIKIGEAVIETESRQIKVDGVLIEV